MATIKSYSDLQQSKKLAEILPLESADMCYINGSVGKIHIGGWKDEMHDEDDLPCWSLSALLSVLPFIDFTTPQLIGTPKTLYRCIYNDDLKSHPYDNPVDACYELILKLNELHLL